MYSVCVLCVVFRVCVLCVVFRVCVLCVVFISCVCCVCVVRGTPCWAGPVLRGRLTDEADAVSSLASSSDRWS